MGKQNYARRRKDEQVCLRKTQTILIVNEGKILYNNRRLDTGCGPTL